VRRGLVTDLVLMRARGELLNEVPDECRVIDLKSPRMRSVSWPLRRYLRGERPDAVLASMWPLTAVTTVAVRTSGVRARLVVSEHSDLRRARAIKSWERRLLRRYGRLLYGAATAVVGVSQGVSDSLVECAGLAAERPHVIYNPVRLPVEAGLPEGDTDLIAWWNRSAARLISVGSLKHAKDYPTLFRATALLREQVDARLLILGEGSERKELEALVGRMNLVDAVRMPGYRRNPSSYVKKADLFVLSSAWEGLPTVIIEALACGTPVVATDCRSGPREILCEGKYGGLVPVGDEKALAQEVLDALSRRHNREALMERAGFFSVERAAEEYLALLLPGRRPQGVDA
jgi:glycosyltransferase involved in cell wall biosynthesis